MAKLRIGVLYDYWWGEDEERAGGHPAEAQEPPTRTCRPIFEALKETGHDPVFLRLDGTRESLVELAHSETDLIFNLIESFGGDDTQDSDVAGLPRDAAPALHRHRLAGPPPGAGQGAGQEDLRLPRHPHALLRHRLPRPHRARRTTSSSR